MGTASTVEPAAGDPGRRLCRRTRRWTGKRPGDPVRHWRRLHPLHWQRPLGWRGIAYHWPGDPVRHWRRLHSLHWQRAPRVAGYSLPFPASVLQAAARVAGSYRHGTNHLSCATGCTGCCAQWRGVRHRGGGCTGCSCAGCSLCTKDWPSLYSALGPLT